MSTKTLLSTFTTKGQVTLPVAIRRRLNLREHGQVAFVMDETGRVELQAPKYSSVTSLTGAAGLAP
jgi:AbrB family looped-hinge helix DNA binding protein